MQCFQTAGRAGVGASTSFAFTRTRPKKNPFHSDNTPHASIHRNCHNYTPDGRFRDFSYNDIINATLIGNHSVQAHLGLDTKTESKYKLRVTLRNRLHSTGGKIYARFDKVVDTFLRPKSKK